MNKPLSLLISSHRFPLNGRVKLLTQPSGCLFILNLSFFGSDFREIALRGFFIRSTFHLTQP